MDDRSTIGRDPVGRGPGGLALSLRTSPDGPALLTEQVTERDLSEVVSESWLEQYLRGGRFDDPQSLDRRLALTTATGDGAPSGYVLETRDGRGHVGRTDFTVLSLEHVAARAADRLIGQGRLEPGDLYYYRLEAAEPRADSPERAPSSKADESGIRLQSRSQPLDVRSLPLGPLLDVARPVGPQGQGFFPVFYTEEAHRKSEAYSRRGGDRTPPEESGGVLVGPLCSCPETQEFFVVVCEVLEARDAEQNTYSLAYSGRTWARIQAIVGAMRRTPTMREFRIVGQCHGHNFLPADGAAPCEACAHVETCSRTSVFVSSDDLNWSRAVFAHQPWKLCHIYGWNARTERVEGLFGLRDGRLLERGYHVIPHFDPGAGAG